MKANVYKMVILFSVLTLITACSTVTKDNNLNSEISSVNDSSHITEKDVVKVLEENGVILVDAELSKANVFGSKLENVNPGSYKLEEKPFFIYEFENEKELEKGLMEFAEMTATMDLVSSSMFRKRNILIFYVHEQDINSVKIPFEKEIQEGLNSIIEG